MLFVYLHVEIFEMKKFRNFQYQQRLFHYKNSYCLGIWYYSHISLTQTYEYVKISHMGSSVEWDHDTWRIYVRFVHVQVTIRLLPCGPVAMRTGSNNPFEITNMLRVFVWICERACIWVYNNGGGATSTIRRANEMKAASKQHVRCIQRLWITIKT